ncbi:TPA: hypothetical protein QDB15_000025 [Burkholderia vietnamiensis]|uniref:Uncharacterized protein n=1 Tax=Pandoraea apista TaxID=93218 RepID=A0A5E5P1J8_9BURK|nr:MULTISPECIES: hypothetical protein [Burkholderiaceae]MCA8206299.1 hypothetical protein [Burkholderia vietnamiensis]VVG70432.1 hypothetical protein PAP18089_01392 [Pandoraea apista]HDR8943097.1 hypothetical protein [Burkholderia vietnamiensis]HDR9116301.1 hypothetical protein [Burkholderia vietnamiensis]HDR9205347.1 hypothetical protein [Burkholderia vietnamiensis]
MTNDELKAMQDRRERHRQAEIPVQALIYAGRYGEALAAIIERFSGEDQTAVPERFPFDLDTWLCQVVGMVRESAGRAAFIRELMALNETDPVPAVWRVANTHGVQPDVYPELVVLLGSNLNREVSLYVTPGLNLSTRKGSEVMQGPLWLVLLLCVCRPTRATSIGVLAYKKSFCAADIAWIDQAASLAAKHGADLGLCKTVTWKRSKPVQQDMVAIIEARHLRQAVSEDTADQEQPIRARGRARL